MDVKAKTPHTVEYKVVWRHRCLALLALCGLALELMGQQRSATAATSEAQGSLRVTVTVQSSVGIVIDKDGQPQVIVANAPDVRDGVVYWKEAGPGSQNAQESQNSHPASAITDTPSPKLKAKQANGRD